MIKANQKIIIIVRIIIQVLIQKVVVISKVIVVNMNHRWHHPK